jgi:hypothetical protein
MALISGETVDAKRKLEVTLEPLVALLVWPQNVNGRRPVAKGRLYFKTGPDRQIGCKSCHTSLRRRGRDLRPHERSSRKRFHCCAGPALLGGRHSQPC